MKLLPVKELFEIIPENSEYLINPICLVWIVIFILSIFLINISVKSSNL